MKRSLAVLLFVVVALSGCTQPLQSGPEATQVHTSQEGEAPTLTVESLDNSIPLGDSFPILVKLGNMPPNQKIDLQMTNAGVTPSVSEASVTSGSLGQAELRLSGRATRAQLDALNVRAFFEGGTVANLLLVNFEPPYEGELQTQAEPVIGEPITHEQYVKSLPVANSLDELKAYEADPPSALRLNGVRFPEEDGSMGEPIDLIEYNTGSQTGDGVVSAQASGCSSGNTYVYAQTYVDGGIVPLPVGTKVFISGDAPDQTRYVSGSGKLCFTFNSGKRIDFRVQGWTTTGIYLHVPGDGYRLASWLRTWFAPSGGTLTASNILGDAMRLARSSSDSWYRALRVFYKINRVYNWERFAPGNPYTSFPLSVAYPDFSIYRSRAGYGRMFIDAGDYSYDPTLFHEFGHEVYYRRLLGEDTYRYHHEQAVNRGQTAVPLCVGSTGWSVWEQVDGCAGMLEGFALWFETVSTMALGTQTSDYFSPEIKPAVSSTRQAGAGVPGRVAQYLYDDTDIHSSGYKTSDLDGDKLISYTSDIRARYANVARYFYSAPPNEDFQHMWKYRITAKLTAAQEDNHRAEIIRNTLDAPGCP